MVFPMFGRLALLFVLVPLIELMLLIKLSAKVGGRKIVGIPKLEDANDAGGKFSEECTNGYLPECLAGIAW